MMNIMATVTKQDKVSRPRIPADTYRRVQAAALMARLDPEEFLEQLIERNLPPQFQKNPRKS